MRRRDKRVEIIGVTTNEMIGECLAATDPLRSLVLLFLLHVFEGYIF